MPKREVQILDTGSELAVNRLVKRIMTATGPWEYYFEKWRPVRTLDQNKYYWGVVLDYAAAFISDQYGESVSKDQAHEMMKTRFLPYREVVMPDGEINPIPASTTGMDTAEFTNYVDQIILWLAEFGVDVPAPDGTLKRRPPPPEWSEETAA